MVEPPHYLADENLSRAWAKAFINTMERGVEEISPLTIAITGLDEERPLEEPDIRRVLDEALVERRRPRCHTVANTIFPNSLWTPEAGRGALFERYARSWPMIKKASKNNRKGAYFQRMTSFGSEGRTQLEHVISTYTGGTRRRSALQVGIFDPSSKDHNNQPLNGFPCLQYVSFAPFDKTKLRVTGVYATQYLFEKAYGNYLLFRHD